MFSSFNHTQKEMDTNITNDPSIVLNLERDWDFVCMVTIPVKVGSEPIGFSIYAEKATIAYKHIIYDGVTTKSAENAVEAINLALEGIFKVVLERRSDVVLSTQLVKSYDKMSDTHYIKEDSPEAKVVAVAHMNYDTAVIYDNLCVLSDYLSDTAESGSYSTLPDLHEYHTLAYKCSIGKTFARDGSPRLSLLKPLYLDCYHLEYFYERVGKSWTYGFNTKGGVVEQMAFDSFIRMTAMNNFNFLNIPSYVCEETTYEGDSKGYQIRILGMEVPLAIFRSKKDAILFAKEFIRLVDEQIATTLTC